ncbi:MAG: hypothetical protein JNK05_23055 [Myxococcales bacterium]|nr:hypothetical protein [Myxococcales bacterium]
MNRREFLAVGSASVASLTAASLLAPNAVLAQAAPVDFTLPTTSGRDRAVSQFRGKVVVLFYETRGTITQNQHVKDAMGARFNRDRTLANRFSLIAACNVAEYNSWPSQYFAREAITTVARSQRIELWLDWNRTLIQRLGLRDGTSNIVLIDKLGRIRERNWGRVADANVNALLDRMIALGNE